MDNMNVYIALSKDKKVMSGALGQNFFTDSTTLRKSLGADSYWRREAREQGCKVKDLYEIHEFTIDLEQGKKVD